MVMLRLLLSLSFLTLSFSAKADFNQFLSKQEGMNSLDNVEIKDNDRPGHGVRRGTDYLKGVEVPSDASETSHLPGETAPDADFTGVIKDRGNQGMGTMKTQDGYLAYKKSDLIKEKHRKGESSLTFSNLKDSFDYKDGRGTFEKIFEGPGDVTKGAYLIVSRESYLLRSYVDLFWKGSLGLGLSYGQGVFINGETADANFRLWKVPADLGLGFSIPVGDLFSLSLSGGGSMMFLLQNRSDVNKRNEKRNRRQFSPGYFAEAKFKWNLGKLFEDTSFLMIREYDVSNLYLDFMVRQHEYNNFKEENLSVSGQSVGAGFSFEFL